MLAAHPIDLPISEPLTWTQICERYPDEWVCIVEIGWLDETHGAFTTARVVGHGKTRKEPIGQSDPWWDRYDSIGHFFTGRVRGPVPWLLR